MSSITFNSPVQITIPYTQAQILGMDEKSLRIFYYNAIKDTYQLVDGFRSWRMGQ